MGAPFTRGIDIREGSPQGWSEWGDCHSGGGLGIRRAPPPEGISILEGALGCRTLTPSSVLWVLLGIAGGDPRVDEWPLRHRRQVHP